ncbi:Com family DNA-binding transcriptional regulator [Aquaspirillum serpens]|uniref:Com family DNA-binding transcriptional regulator n=1 Tax=Aquaspirillum serpens TaxID=190 RepID=UPI0009DBEF80
MTVGGGGHLVSFAPDHFGQIIDLAIKCPRCGTFNRFTHQSATSRQNPERPERQTAQVGQWNKKRDSEKTGLSIGNNTA